MTFGADLERIERMMVPVADVDAARSELETLDAIRTSLEESGIIEGFDPFDYSDISDEEAETDAYRNQNIPEGK